MKKLNVFLFLGLIFLNSCLQDESTPDIISFDEGVANILESEIITLKSGTIIEKRGDNYIFEGDIILSPEQFKNLEETGTIFGNLSEKTEPDLTLHPLTNLPLELYSNETKTRALGINPTPYNLWAMVRFVYSPRLTDFQRSCIRRALLNIQSRTNVRFYNATGKPIKDPVYGFDYPYIEFVPSGNQDTSDSYVGRKGGRQAINLADFAFNFFQTSVIEHEIGHAIGMLHEQCRPDRDNHIEIVWSNLTASGKAAFNKRNTNYYMIGTYDFNSIMGYSSMTSSTSMVVDTSKPMYTRKDDKSHIHQGTEFSDSDRMWVNRFYLPYIARSDVYAELDEVVYKSDNTIMTQSERLQLQAQLNNGNPNPPAGGRIQNDF